ncbi:MAG: FprA family A-type flavoprotein [Porcipelethomonas sp.]
MSDVKISDAVLYIGVDDREIDLFESQYDVPNGVSYNSYIIIDEKIAVMDTADMRVSEKWFANLEKALAGKTPDYLVISHLEPDHAGNIKLAAEKYPEMKLVLNAKSAAMLPQFFDIDVADRSVIVKEGDELSLGNHTLHFFMAPMVHWPEVMVEYEKTEKILFSADGFGKFGALDTDEDWACEARRYYFNIVGKYGAQVQALLKKASALDIKTICPLHGPILSENLEYYIGKYATWSSYEPEDEGVLVAYASIHGNTAAAAKKMKEILESKGAKKVAITDLARDDMAEAVEDAFRYNALVLAASSYDAGVFPCMEEFLHHLKAKNYQKRTVGIIENGSWAPSAAKTMKGILEGMKNITLTEPVVTIKSTMKDSDIPKMEELAEAVLK